MRGHDDAGSLGGDPFDQRTCLDHVPKIQAACRLVEQDDGATGKYGICHGKPLPLSSRKRHGMPVREGEKVEGF